MTGFMSFAELSAVVKDGMTKVPDHIDMVVGIPRSGMIPAYMIGLFRNLPVIDLPGFVCGDVAAHGSRPINGEASRANSARSILLVDDSLSSGGAMKRAREQVAASGYAGRLTTCVAIIEPLEEASADIYFRKMPGPRCFEWNVFHLPSILQSACFDLDGVFCEDPSETQNDDGLHYEEFLRTAAPRFTPSGWIKQIVSSRLEKYRALTEEWLARHGIHYGTLSLLDLPSAAVRRKLAIHASYKAEVYRRTDSDIFIESDPQQADNIARLAGKQTLCTATMQMYYPPLLNWPLKEIAKRYCPARFTQARRLVGRLRALSNVHTL